MTRADRLAHVSGYGAIVAVLALADWSGIMGTLVGLVYVFGVTVYAGLVGYEKLTSRLRAEAEAAATDGPEPTPAADGGRRDDQGADA